MTRQDTSSLGSARPIRELIDPATDRLVNPSDVTDERRKAHRFARRLYGSMTHDGLEHSVTCVDIGYGGMRVITSGFVAIAEGDQVTIEIKQGSQWFRDTFSACETRRTPNGTEIHLTL